MKIGIDLDEVTVDFLNNLLIFYNKKTGRSLSKKDFHSYNFWEVWGGTREEAIQIVEEFHSSDNFENISPIDSSIHSIADLAKKHEILIITSRPVVWKEKTKSWVKKHLTNISLEIIHSGDFHEQGKTKAAICKEKEINLIIEDNGKYALECAESGIPVILFDQPWNKKISHSLIKRVYDWPQALKEID